MSDPWLQGGVAWGAPSPSGKFYKGPSADTPWNNDLLAKLSAQAELKILGMKETPGHWRMGSFVHHDGRTKMNIKARPNRKARKLIRAQQEPKRKAARRRRALKLRNALASAQLVAKRAAARGERVPRETLAKIERIKKAQETDQRAELARLQRARGMQKSASRGRKQNNAQHNGGKKKELPLKKKLESRRIRPQTSNGVERQTRRKCNSKPYKTKNAPRRPGTSHVSALPRINENGIHNGKSMFESVYRKRRPTTSRSRMTSATARTWATSDQQLVDDIEDRMGELEKDNKLELLMAVEERLNKLEENLIGGLNNIRKMKDEAEALGQRGKEARRMSQMHYHVNRLKNQCIEKIERRRRF